MEAQPKRAGRRRLRSRRRVKQSIVFGLAAANALAPELAVAGHGAVPATSPAYPADGFAIMARNLDGGQMINLISDDCRPWEVNAFAITESTTSGSRPEFRSAWPSGIGINRTACGTSTVTNTTDIILDYKTTAEFGGTSPGAREQSLVASGGWCDTMGYPKDGSGRCGIHPSRISINRPRVLGYANDTIRTNHLVHELAHSFGLLDNSSCGTATIMNSGSPCSLQTDGWKAVDRRAMRDHIYPNWKY